MLSLQQAGTEGEPHGGGASLIGQLVNLLELYDDGKQLSRRLPTERGVRSLSSNSVRGSLPTQFNQLVKLQVLSLHGGSQSILMQDYADGETTTATIGSFICQCRTLVQNMFERQSNGMFHAARFV